MSVPLLTDFADLVANHLLNGLILSACIFVGAVILLPLCFRADRWSAATRHWVSLLTFVLLASTPLLVVLKPVQPSRVIQSAQAAKNETAVTNIPPSPLMGRLIREPISLERKAPSMVKPSWLQNVDWLLLLFADWGLLSLVCGLRLLAALHRLSVLHRSAQPVELAEQLYGSRKITVAESALVSSPVAVGLWPAKVLLPVGFQSQFSAMEQRNVLLHEIAHLERLDDWSTFLQQLLIAAFPINPFLWATNRISQLHQEAACDDRVLIETHQAKSYAHLLARLADGSIERSLLASGVSRQGKQLYQRLTRILDGTRNRNIKPSVRNVMAAAIALIGASVAGLVWLPAFVLTPTVRASESENVIVGPNGAAITRSSLDPEIVSLLTSSALNDPDPSVRQEATCALSEHEGRDVTAALLALFNQSKDEQIRLTILHQMTPRRAADQRVKEKLIDLALHETSVPIRTAAIELLSKNLDETAINQLITIYRTANSTIIRSACLQGLGVADSKTAKEFLISIAKEDPDPQLRRIALRAIAGENEFAPQFVLNGKQLQFPDQFQQQREVYTRSLDDMARLRDEAGIIVTQRAPVPEEFPPQNRLFFLNPRSQEGFDPRTDVPALPNQLPGEPQVDPSPKPSPSVSE